VTAATGARTHAGRHDAEAIPVRTDVLVEDGERIRFGEIALTARYAEDLRPLFADLPAPRPDLPTVRRERAAEPTPVAYPSAVNPTSAQPTLPARSTASWRAITAAAWAVAIIACFASGWQLWWLLFVPLVLGGCGSGHHRHQRDHYERRLAARQAHWDAHMRHFEARMERLDRRRW